MAVHPRGVLKKWPRPGSWQSRGFKDQGLMGFQMMGHRPEPRVLGESRKIKDSRWQLQALPSNLPPGGQLSKHHHLRAARSLPKPFCSDGAEPCHICQATLTVSRHVSRAKYNGRQAVSL